MPTPRLAHAVALAAVLTACGDRATSSKPLPAGPAEPTAADRPADGGAQPSPGIATAGVPAPPAGGAASGGPSDPAAAPAPAAPAVAAPPAAPAPAAPAAGTPAEGGAASPSAIAGTPADSAAAAPAGGAASPAPAPSPAPVWSVLQAASAVEPGGTTIPLARDRDTVVDPGARFEVVLSVASPDARLVLLDQKDALVAAAEAHEVGQATRLTLAPSAPLAPGRRYTLRVDGAATRELHDGAGKAFTPSTLTVRVAGTAVPEPKESQATRRRRRR